MKILYFHTGYKNVTINLKHRNKNLQLQILYLRKIDKVLFAIYKV